MVADNVLRGSSWICVVIASASATPDEESNHANFISTIAPMIGLFFISIEWMTMLSTQMLKSFQQKDHWKHIGLTSNKRIKSNKKFKISAGNNESIDATTDTNDDEKILLHEIEEKNSKAPATKQPPKFVQAIFANNFCNCLGILAMYGLFAAGMITFLSLHKRIILESVPQLRLVLNIALVTAFIGRLLALCVEAWFCFEYMRLVTCMEVNRKNEF